MKTFSDRPFSERANSIVIVLVFTTVCLIVLAGLLGWSTVNTRLTQRYCRYNRSIAAAEAATEKVLTAITTDYKNLGQGYVLNNLDRYRRMNPTSTENPVWAGFTFSDVAGTPGRTYVQYVPGTSFKLLSAQYQGLRGFANTFQIISNAREANTAMAYGAVQQELQLTMVPVFQFAMFYNLDYECNALPNMTVNGPVHCNANIYLTPVNSLTFYNDVTCAGRINTTPKTGNSCGNPAGTINFRAGQYSGFTTLNLPVGTNNSPTAVRQVVEPPPTGESASSSVGSQRFYNKADMIITVRDTDVLVTSGLINNFTTIIPWLQATQFIRTNITFTNQRENKTVRTTQIDINKLSQWNATNALLRTILPSGDIRTIFVDDIRTQSSSTQPGIRLVNGTTLLPQGLTVATPKPLYIWGHYNCTNTFLGTTNTTASRPAAIVADAITVLSTNWTDANSAATLSSRVATDTTVNAAFLAGIVETSTSLGYSGGIENFPRFLEEWTDRTFTYNGSMVVMFTSRYATAAWDRIGTYYNPPIRNWSFDQNFSDPTKLPPSTPAACLPARGNWRVAQPLSTNVTSF